MNQPRLTKQSIHALFGRSIWFFRLMPVFTVATIIALPYLDRVTGISYLAMSICGLALLFLADLYVPLRDWFEARYEVAIRRKASDTLDYTFPLGNAWSAIPNAFYRARLADYQIGEYVYVIKDASASGYYKIGRTNSPQRRIGRFEVILPFDIHIIAIYQCQDMVALETALHRRYADKRVNGEWFKLTGFDVMELAEKDMNSVTGYH